MKLTSLLALVPAFVYSVSAKPIVSENICPGGTVLSTTFIGEHKDVKLEELYCPGLASRDLEARQANVCGAQCNTNCFTPSGGGPDPNECHVISDALLFASQNTGQIFTVGTGTNNTLSLSYRSCTTFFRNQDVSPLNYCRTDMAAVIDFVAFNCQAPQNAHGGNCVAADQRWFIQ
ncbi:hypothetical protein ONZ45_g11254 [Pleurotus djamor]|nr:hypothetical protein ONZ45_g11254 [Pleurotus djamor]